MPGDPHEPAINDLNEWGRLHCSETPGVCRAV